MVPSVSKSASEQLSAVVAELMRADGVGLRELARRMGRPHDYVGRRLRNAAGWKLDDLRLLSRALHVDERTLLDRLLAG
jgi:hypothetical protein